MNLLRAAVAFGLTILFLPIAPAGDPGSLKPVNLDKVNTSADEDDPFITADGSTLYYASNAAGSFDLMVSQRRGGTAWPAGKPLDGLNTRDADERSPFVARDGKFYFATNAV